MMAGKVLSTDVGTRVVTRGTGHRGTVKSSNAARIVVAWDGALRPDSEGDGFWFYAFFEAVAE